MRRFTSYGPPDPDIEFMVERSELVQHIANQLVGSLEKGGHYFTIFAPRQVGKTTTLRQVVTLLRQQLGDSVRVGMATMHSLKDFRRAIPWIFKLAFDMKVEQPEHWDDVQKLFSDSGPLGKPTLLILDEFDALPGPELAETIATFRQLYLERKHSHLHGLALIGVHAVLGDVTGTTSPFNIQRAVNVPSLTKPEVFGLFEQYVQESGQAVTPEAMERIWELFRGQPGLTCWFGELLTEKYNPVQPPPYLRPDGPPPEGYPPVTLELVSRTTESALYEELNNNIRNLISKGKAHAALLSELFFRHDLPFDLNHAEVQWLYLNGILVGEANPDRPERKFCAFASPFVQRCLFSVFGQALTDSYRALQLIQPEDALQKREALLRLDVPILLTLYRRFLARQAAQGEAPWSQQPARSDARAFEAIGHFNLYAWLYVAARNSFSVVPEFPTGNGTADLWLVNHRQGLQEVLEVKSFSDTSDVRDSLAQVVRYARTLKLTRAWLVVMADPTAYVLLQNAPTRYIEAGIEIGIEVIPWGFVPDEASGVSEGVRRSSEGALEPARTLPVKAGRSSQSKSDGGSRSTGTSRRKKKAAPVLNLQERLALEALIVPLLTKETLQVIRDRLMLERDADTSVGFQAAWPRLARHMLESGLGADLGAVLAFTFPELASHPLLVKLSAG